MYITKKEFGQNSDYAIYSFYEKEDAENLLLKAKDVVSKIKDVLKDKFNIELDL
ncbi:MAG: hypothetical protein GF311_27170 [Candidatus Lokiarchaeota archaeon]|nr:hypothetical protein [Candidatus Lokiarchaeota archaeon]